MTRRVGTDRVADAIAEGILDPSLNGRRDPEQSLTDTGNASRLIALHGARLRYVPTWGKWLVWSNKEGRWTVDLRDVFVREAAKDVGRQLRDEAAAAIKREEGTEQAAAAKKRLEFGLRSLEAKRIRDLVDLSRGIDGIPIHHEQLDAGPALLGVQNGVVDLATGNLRRADPRDLMTMQAPVRYAPDAQAPRWEQAMSEWFPDEDTRAYVQRVAGAALFGAQRDHTLIIHYGGGGNGKGTFSGTIQHVLGPYARVIHLSLLVDSKHEQHDTVKADLFRIRLAVAVELKRRVQLAEASVKNLTGGDRISARRMREDPWEFDPSHSLWLQTNHLPEISGRDAGIWRRIRVVKWVSTFSKTADDPYLKETLKDEAPGILRWLVAGCLAWQQKGLAEPEAVLRDTLAYRQKEDVFARFAADSGLQFVAGLNIQASELQRLLMEWAEAEGIQPSQQDFRTWLDDNGAKQTRPRWKDAEGKRRQTRLWQGIGVGE